MSLKIGFTGTRRGMTDQQKDSFRRLMVGLGPDEFHQGCCAGADEEATIIVAELVLSCRIFAHPGRSAKGGENEQRSNAALDRSHAVYPEQTHFARNRAIVSTCDVLVAAPWQAREQEPAAGTGGGTWYTIQQARKTGKRVVIIWPDGVETRE